ncbi:MAG: hypothetical protein JWN76_3799 [Chitinophagaceae bacterium]|nr:hypothetical protein [Chitinophagaceae bacterium]
MEPALHFFTYQHFGYLLLGYLFSIAGSGVLVRLLIAYYRKAKNPAATQMHWEGTVVGVVEAVLYTTSWVMHFPAFIALWLIIKVANRFKVKSGDPIAEITAGNLFLTGTGLNVLYGVAGGFLFLSMAQEEWLMGVSAALLLVLITIGLILFVRSKMKRAE